MIDAKGYAGGIPVYCAFDKIEDIGNIKPNPQNPNKHPDEQIELLAKIIEVQGWRAPVTVSTLSGLVVRGHGRLMAAQYLRLESVPVDYQHYNTADEEIADLIADNRIAELAGIDNEQLTELLAGVDFDNIDVEITGYTDDIVNDLLNAIEEDETEIIGEVPFTEVLREEHNYIVLYFDNEVDWLQAESLFNIETAKALSTRKDGIVTEKSERKGVGRVLNGAKALEDILNEYQCKLPVL